MNKPQKPNPETDELQLDAELERELAELETAIASVKDRHQQIITDQQKQRELQQQIDVIKIDLRRTQKKELQSELKQLQQQLELIELNLESKLIVWDEPFWLAVRFGGLGLIIGWILKSLVH
jgi:hypothetical protein